MSNPAPTRTETQMSEQTTRPRLKSALVTVGVAGLLAVGGAALPATPLAPAQPAEAAMYTSCYTAMNGTRWCYRYACTAREEMSGCYEGWVRMNSVWYA
jgi:hypothetical protein